MSVNEIPDSVIATVAKFINKKNNTNYQITVVGNQDNIETPQVFEIVSFDTIDQSPRNFYAIDGSYNSEQFYNGLAIGIYTAGYVCFAGGKQQRMNSTDDPLILGRSYHPTNILVTSDDHLGYMYDELLGLAPVKNLLAFWQKVTSATTDEIFSYAKDKVCANLSTLLNFCQEVLELSLILEVAERSETKAGDFILRDGTLRPLQVKQEYLVQLGRYLKEKKILLVAVTKQSAIKMELGYTFKQIDNYLQDKLKQAYPFKQEDPKRQKLCCWFEVPAPVLQAAFPGGGQFIKKSVKGGRGFGLFFATRLDYVEKLQNYDWLIIDVNILDAVPNIDTGNETRDITALKTIFLELTRLTQEHYILGYPYPLAEAHNFVSLKKNFKDEIVNRLKYALYSDQHMDNVDIENLFLDTHDRF